MYHVRSQGVDEYMINVHITIFTVLIAVKIETWGKHVYPPT